MLHGTENEKFLKKVVTDDGYRITYESNVRKRSKTKPSKYPQKMNKSKLTPRYEMICVYSNIDGNCSVLASTTRSNE